MTSTSNQWRVLCEELLDEEYDWILMSSDFRSPSFTVLGKGAAESGFARVVKALPADQVLIVFVRPPELTAHPYLIIWSPVDAPFRHVSNLQTLKENFWLNFLAGGPKCPSKTETVHNFQELCTLLDPSGNLHLDVFPPELPPEPEPDISNLLSGLDQVVQNPDQPIPVPASLAPSPAIADPEPASTPRSPRPSGKTIHLQSDAPPRAAPYSTRQKRCNIL